MTQILWKLKDLKVGDSFLLRDKRFVINFLRPGDSALLMGPMDIGDLASITKEFAAADVTDIDTGQFFTFPADMKVQPIELKTRVIR